MQETSLQAYFDEIVPTLGRRQGQVLEILTKSMTNSEIAQRLNWPINTVTPRIFELRGKGMVVEDCTRICSVTGRRAIAWKANIKSIELPKSEKPVDPRKFNLRLGL